jgi:hypothetical protein
MADLSSDDLKEREELLVSAMIIAQPECNNWSELLSCKRRGSTCRGGGGMEKSVAM